jgi:hypothetical protein
MGNWMFEFKCTQTKYPGIYEYAWRVKHPFDAGCTLGTRDSLGSTYETLCWIERFDPKTASHLVGYIEKGVKSSGGWFAKEPANVCAPNGMRVYKTRETAALEFLLTKMVKEASDLKAKTTSACRWMPREEDPLIGAVEADDILQVLRQECGFGDHDLYFLGTVTKPRGVANHFGEFRFSGFLGFGGKFFYDRSGYFVSNYSEDSDGATQLMIAKTNRRLEMLWHKHSPPRAAKVTG